MIFKELPKYKIRFDQVGIGSDLPSYLANFMYKIASHKNEMVCKMSSFAIGKLYKLFSAINKDTLFHNTFMSWDVTTGKSFLHL